MNIKQNNGIGSVDAIIAIVILMIFTGIIATVSTNIYNQSQYIKRNDAATNFIVEIFEYAHGISYDDVTSSELVNYINNNNNNVEAVEGEKQNWVNMRIYNFYKCRRKISRLY